MLAKNNEVVLNILGSTRCDRKLTIYSLEMWQVNVNHF